MKNPQFASAATSADRPTHAPAAPTSGGSEPRSQPRRVSVGRASGASAVPRRIAYLVNRYPAVSHTFIRREILALEPLGFAVDRISVRGWDEKPADPTDIAEQARTRYLLRDGAFALVASGARILVGRPAKFMAALRATLRRAWRSDRAAVYHLIYLLEACRLVEWMEAAEIEFLHSHFATNSADVAMLARLLGGPPFSFTAHGGAEYDRYEQLGIDDKVHHAAFAVAISSHTRSQLFRRIPADQWPKVQVVHCGLDGSFHSGAPTPVPDNKTVLCIGRLAEEKGQLLLINALSRVRAQGIDGQLVLAGDGPMRAVIEARIAELGLRDHVRITGWISTDEVRKEILAARALVCSSFQEGLPIVIMEAMALRRPVISTTIAGIPELVQPGRTGWLVPAGSETDLATALSACLSTPVATLQTMGEAAHAIVTERHDIDRSAAELAHLFNHAIAAGGQSR